ncbi:uncharacterized protein LOC144947542 isoform X2 [Lampetra fluviatilis]
MNFGFNLKHLISTWRRADPKRNVCLNNYHRKHYPRRRYFPHVTPQTLPQSLSLSVSLSAPSFRNPQQQLRRHHAPCLHRHNTQRERSSPQLARYTVYAHTRQPRGINKRSLVSSQPPLPLCYFYNRKKIKMRALPLLCFAAAIAAAASSRLPSPPLDVLAGSDQRPPQPLQLQPADQSERRIHQLAAAAAPLDVLAGSDQRPPQQLQSADQSERRIHQLAAAAPPLDVLAGSDQRPPPLHLQVADQSERRIHRLAAAIAKIPPHEQVARVARFVAHAVDWAALATLSGRDPPGPGLPFASVFSVSDGPVGNASGVPYMYLSSLDVSVKDIAADPRVSMAMTLASTDYCTRSVYDPQSPLCARVTFIGNVSRVVDEAEAAFAVMVVVVMVVVIVVVVLV